MRRFVVRVAIGLALVAVVAIYQVGKSLFFGNGKGELCVDSGDCRGNLLRFGSQCMQDSYGSYCTSRCDDASDCDPGWVCTEVGVSNNPFRKENVCARPVATP